jgi:hypothetical protein
VVWSAVTGLGDGRGALDQNTIDSLGAGGAITGLSS